MLRLAPLSNVALPKTLLHPSSSILSLCSNMHAEACTLRHAWSLTAAHVQIKERKAGSLVQQLDPRLVYIGMKMNLHGRSTRCSLLYTAAAFVAICFSTTAQPEGPEPATTNSPLTTPPIPPPLLEVDTRAGAERDDFGLRSCLQPWPRPPPPPPPPLTLLSGLKGPGSTDGAKHSDCCWCARAVCA